MGIHATNIIERFCFSIIKPILLDKFPEICWFHFLVPSVLLSPVIFVSISSSRMLYCPHYAGGKGQGLIILQDRETFILGLRAVQRISSFPVPSCRRINLFSKKRKISSLFGYNGRGRECRSSNVRRPLGCLSVFLLWPVKAPSSACHVSNLSFDMSGTIIPSFVTSFDQRMKNCCLTQTKLLLGKGQLEHTGIHQGETWGISLRLGVG